MSQYTLYKNENKSTKKTYPYFVNVQSDLLDDLNSRIVIPLTPLKILNDNNVKKLCPIIEVEDKSFVLLTHQLTSVPNSILKKESISLENHRYEILGAIDLLLTGI